MDRDTALMNVRRVEPLLRDVLNVIESIREMASIEANIVAAQGRLNALRGQEADLAAEMRAHKDAAMADAARTIQAAHDEAGATRRASEDAHAEAKTTADNTRAAAIAQATEIVESAQREAEHHQGTVAAARERLTELEQKIEAMLAHHADLGVKTTAKTAELERINAAKTAALASLAL